MSDDLFAGGTPRRDLFGGSGTVTVRTLGVAGHGLPAPFTAALACVLEPGGHVGKHRQEHDDEFVLITDGRGEATLDAARVELGSGVLLPVPLGTVMSLRASDEGPLRYLIIKAHQRG